MIVCGGCWLVALSLQISSLTESMKFALIMINSLFSVGTMCVAAVLGTSASPSNGSGG